MARLNPTPLTGTVTAWRLDHVVDEPLGHPPVLSRTGGRTIIVPTFVDIGRVGCGWLAYGS
jgi:hypothetical protein